jgi:ABC-2 type transport system permease protein
MRRTWQIAAKELLETRRDGLAALFTIILPVVFTVFLGMLLGGAATDTLPVAVVDSDASASSLAFVQRLQSSPLLKIREMQAGEIDKAVKDQKVAAALVIPQGFGAGVDSADSSKSVSLTLVSVQTSSGAQSVQQAVQTAIAEFNASLLATRTAVAQVSQATGGSTGSAMYDQAAALTGTQLASPVVSVALVNAGTGDTAPAGGFDQSSTGGLVNWVLFGIMGVAGMTVWERKRGLLKRLNVAGVTAREIVGGKLIAMIVITLLQQVLLVIVGRFALGVDYFSNPLALVLVMLSMSGLAASFGLLVAVLFRSEQAVTASTVSAALLLAALGGAWFPLEVTNSGFSRAAHVLPSAWLMDSLHGITLSGWGVMDVLMPLGIVWAWVVVLAGLAVLRYRPD